MKTQEFLDLMCKALDRTAGTLTLEDTPQSVDKFLSNPDSGFWLAYVGDTPAGCVVLRPLGGIDSA